MFGISGCAQASFTLASSTTELAYTIRTTPSNSEPVSSILLVQSNVDIPVSDIFTLIFFSTSSTNLVLVPASTLIDSRAHTTQLNPALTSSTQSLATLSEEQGIYDATSSRYKDLQDLVRLREATRPLSSNTIVAALPPSKLFTRWASALKLTEKTNEYVGGGKEVNVLQLTSKIALDIIGITSFRYKFNSLNDGQTELMAALYNVFGESQMWPTKREFLFTALWHILPEWVLLLLEWLPSRASRLLERFKDVASKVSRPIFEKQLDEVANDANPSEKDVVNVLSISHLADDMKKKMSNPEIDSQLATFIVAGHDTTAGAIAWLLYEMSRHPEVQTKVREEIVIAKSKAPGALTWADYDAMTWLNASIKEVLRYHPLAYGLFREAAQDDVLVRCGITSHLSFYQHAEINATAILFRYIIRSFVVIWGISSSSIHTCCVEPVVMRLQSSAKRNTTGSTQIFYTFPISSFLISIFGMMPDCHIPTSFYQHTEINAMAILFSVALNFSQAYFSSPCLNGQLCSEIPISKGQIIFASVYTYNCLPSVWGDDATEWNPHRFLEDWGIKQESLGAYVNLMTFSAGICGYLGWRFA
ncbi:cytochrome P450 [Armillaria mellea]|nr:cytochrome P450 [Armillaria mellea]